MKTIDLRKARERQRREEYKECILHAAEAVILRKGFGTTTMDDIAREAQFSKATLYNYFKGKAELVEEIILHFYDDMKMILEEILSLDIAPTKKLKKAIQAALAFYEGKENLLQIIMTDESLRGVMKSLIWDQSAGFSASDKRFIRIWREKYQVVLGLGADIMKEGIRNGEFRAMDVSAAVTYLNAVLQGILHVRSWIATKPDAQKDADMIYGFLIHGFAVPGRPRKGEVS